MFPEVDNPNQFIFVKEVLAATLALNAAGARGIKSADLLIDNSAGASAIRNGFSNNALTTSSSSAFFRNLGLVLRVVAAGHLRTLETRLRAVKPLKLIV